MIRKALLVMASLGVGLVVSGYLMYVWNPAPRVSTRPAAELVASGRPVVVKLHAQWCPVCMMTKAMWSQVEETYAGRVQLVVLDFTNQATTDASAATADRAGLGGVFADWSGVTGTVLVVDGLTKEVTASIAGSRDFGDYRDAIDAALYAQASRRREAP